MHSYISWTLYWLDLEPLYTALALTLFTAFNGLKCDLDILIVWQGHGTQNKSDFTSQSELSLLWEGFFSTQHQPVSSELRLRPLQVRRQQVRGTEADVSRCLWAVCWASFRCWVNRRVRFSERMEQNDALQLSSDIQNQSRTKRAKNPQQVTQKWLNRGVQKHKVHPAPRLMIRRIFTSLLQLYRQTGSFVS